MKSRKILIFAAILMIVGLSSHAFAAAAFYICDVEAVGTASNGVSVVQLKEANGAWGPLYFVLPTNVAKEQLALSITAQINKKQVLVNVDIDVLNSAVNTMLLLK